MFEILKKVIKIPITSKQYKFKKLISQVYYFAYYFQVKWIEIIILIKCNQKLHQISQDRCFSKNKTRKYSRIGGHFPNHVPVIYKVTLSSSVDTMECLAVVRALQFGSECGFCSITWRVILKQCIKLSVVKMSPFPCATL